MGGDRVQRLGMNLLDRTIAVFDPIGAAARMKARTQLAALEAYGAASVTKRSMFGWATSGGSADVDVLPGLGLQRRRSRDLERNAPIATGAIASTVTSVVGTGLTMQCAIDAEFLGMSDDDAAAWQRNTEREWRLWAETTDCDITRHQDIYGLQDLSLRSVLVNGDAFTVLPYVTSRYGCPYDLRIQLVEADRVCNKDNAPNTTTLAGGVKMDEYGAPVEYHILREHPGGLTPISGTWDVYKAFGTKTGRRNVLHHFHRKRIGQSRGTPWLSAVVEPLKQMDRYAEAEITAAVVAGMLSVFVTTEGGQGFNTAAGGLAGETGAAQTDKDIKLAPGAIIDLQPGEQVTAVTPGRPSPNFDPFFQAFLRQVGVALEVPFEVLLKHFQSSYSAARAALVEAWKFYMGRRAWLIQSFCQPVYEAWLEEAVSLGRVQAPGFFDDPAIRCAYCGTVWHGDAMPQLDPEKEVNAARSRIEGALSTHARETAALTGADWDTEHKRLSREIKDRQTMGTIIDLNPKVSDRVAEPLDKLGDPNQPAEPAGPTGAPSPAEPPKQRGGK